MALEYNAQKTQEQLRKALDFAKQNPNHPDALELRRRMEIGQFNFELRNMGLPEVPIERPKLEMPNVQQQPSVQTETPEPPVLGRLNKETGRDVLEVATGMGDQMSRGADKIQDVWNNKNLNVLQKFVGTTGAAAGAGAGVIGEAFTGVGKMALSQESEDKLLAKMQEIGEDISETEVAKGVVDWYEGLDESEKVIIDAGGGVLALAAEFVGLKGAGKVTSATVDATAPVVRQGLDMGQQGLETAARSVDQLFVPSQAKLEAKVNDLYQRAVKPTIQGKKNIGDVDKSKQQQLNAISTINKNAPELKYTNEIGEVVEGRAPQSLNEFAQSIQQTKENVYTEYNSLAKQTGDAGIKVNPSEFVDELDTFINDRSVQIAAPETVKYAQAMKTKFGDINDLSPEEVENLIKLYNQDLNTFYRNPTADQGRKVAVDALIVNNLRKQLDETIEKATGQQYQTLKTQYGALRSIEKDVLNATLRDARRNVNGLIDYTDIFTGGELAAGILTMNPGLLAKAGVQKGIKEYFSFRNNPNNQVKRMFEIEATLQSRVPDSVGPLEQSVKEGQPGLSIRSTVRPDTIASKMDAEDFANVTKIIDNPELRTQYEDMLSGMGLQNATDDELVSFLKEAVDEYDGVANRPIMNGQ